MKRGVLYAVLVALMILAVVGLVQRNGAQSDTAQRKAGHDEIGITDNSKSVAAKLGEVPATQPANRSTPGPEEKSTRSTTFTLKGNDAKGAATGAETALKLNVGGPQPLNPENNPNVQSVIEAATTGKHSERLTSSIKPKPFDKATFDANPKSYLDIVEPGRIWDTATAGPGVKSIEVKGNDEFEIGADGNATLEVLAVPLAPVTFTSFDYGAFQNSLTSITVRADKDGSAKAVFRPISGTVAGVEIMAASPLNVSQVKFHVRIKDK